MTREAQLSIGAALAIVIILLAKPLTAATVDASFMREINSAMTKMMSAMNICPTGDVDKDFVATMVPHHQGAIAMAEAELKYGRNVKLRRIASEIVVTQEQEIAAMRLALRER